MKWLIILLLFSSCSIYNDVQVDDCMLDAWKVVEPLLPKDEDLRANVDRVTCEETLHGHAMYIEAINTIMVDLPYLAEFGMNDHKTRVITLAHEFAHAYGIPHLEDHPIMSQSMQEALLYYEDMDKLEEDIITLFDNKGEGYRTIVIF